MIRRAGQNPASEHANVNAPHWRTAPTPTTRRGGRLARHQVRTRVQTSFYRALMLSKGTSSVVDGGAIRGGVHGGFFLPPRVARRATAWNGAIDATTTVAAPSSGGAVGGGEQRLHRRARKTRRCPTGWSTPRPGRPRSIEPSRPPSALALVRKDDVGEFVAAYEPAVHEVRKSGTEEWT